MQRGAPSIPELAIDARKAAVDEVERLLQHPEDLKRLDGLLEEYTQKHQVNKAQLSATVSSQVEAARSGMELLETAQRTLTNMRDCYQVIDQLCSECASLIENHEKIQLLSAVHYNLGKTLQDVENIVALPNEAAEAEEMLKDETQLLQAYETLAILEGTSSLAQQALLAGGLTGGAKLKQQDTHNLSVYFNKVKDTMGKFEERLWSLIRNFVQLGHSNPAMLVNAVRIVELQEMVDKQLEASGRAAVPVKRYKRRMEQQIGNCVQDTTAPLLQKCSQLAAAGENTDKKTNEILEEAHNFVMQLADIYDYVSPCFPEKYHIFHVIWRQYHENLAFMMDCMGACAQQLANGDILKVLAWVNQYQETLRDLGIEEDEVRFSDSSSRGEGLLLRKYVERLHSTLNTWCTNILEADFTSEPTVAEDGKIWTPGAVDFFRIVNEQVTVVEEVSRGELLLQVGQMAVLVMRDFQDAQRRYLDKELSVELLCAMVNNNTRCYNESMEFAERVEEALDEEHKGSLDIEQQCRGFLDLSKTATAQLVTSIFADAAFAELFTKLCGTEEWRKGEITGSILATISDYLNDYERLIEASFFKRLSEMCLEETVAHCAAAMLTFIKAITEEVVATMQKDVTMLQAFFSKYLKQDKVTKLCTVIQDLKEVAAADSVDTFVLSYTSLLQVAPGVTPTLIERLVQARSDLSKQDQKEVMEECRDVFANRQRALGDDGAAATKGKTNLVPFKVALAAVKKRPGAPGGPDQRSNVVIVPKSDVKPADAKASGKAAKGDSNKVEKSEPTKVIMLSGPVKFEAV